MIQLQLLGHLLQSNNSRCSKDTNLTSTYDKTLRLHLIQIWQAQAWKRSVEDGYVPPPRAFLKRRQRAINSLGPTMTEPTGAPRPFERHKLTVSHAATIREGGTPSAAAAFIKRAPSMCNANPRRLHKAPSWSMYSGETTRPPNRLCEFSGCVNQFPTTWT